MRFAALLFLGLAGCSAPHSSFTYTDPSGASLVVDLYMKEVEATKLDVDINWEKKTATIKADKWETKSVEVLKAQAKREEIASKIAEKATEAGVKAAIKSFVPIP